MKIGTVEPKYSDAINLCYPDMRLVGGKTIKNDYFALIYGAIAKYAWVADFMRDEEFVNSLKEYIISIASEIGETSDNSENK